MKQPLEIRSKIGSNLYITDENGEVLKTISGGDTYTLMEGQVNTAYVNNVGAISPGVRKKRYRVKNHFIKVNDCAFAEIDPGLIYIYKLLPYIGYQNGVLIYKNGKPIKSYSGVAKICGINIKTATKIMKQVIEQDIIHKVDGKYWFNPFIALRGERATEDLYIEFEDSKWHDINKEEERIRKKQYD